MKRYLKLVLDEECKITLTLFEGERKNVDEYTTKFIDSEEIRYEHSLEIDKFLNENKTLINKVSKSIGRNYSGSIVLIEYEDGITPVRKKVLYKPDLEIYPEVALKISGRRMEINSSEETYYEAVRYAIKEYKECYKRMDEKTRKSLNFKSYASLITKSLKSLLKEKFESPSLEAYRESDSDREPEFIPGSREEKAYYEYLENLPTYPHPHDNGIDDGSNSSVKRIKK